MGEAVFLCRKPKALTAGSIWEHDKDGTFTVPKSGRYKIELYGGGGHAAIYSFRHYIAGDGHYFYKASLAGGGSGAEHTINLTAGVSYDIVIGKGAVVGSNAAGGTTKFGSLLSVAGGGCPFFEQYDNNVFPTMEGGAASGNLATAGRYSNSPGGNAEDAYYPDIIGGYGNANKPTQTYGCGGGVVDGVAQNGHDGAVIITYLGKA